MLILLAGSSGFIGTRLAAHLTELGHTVVPLLRSGETGIRWDPLKGDVSRASLEGFDAVINLGGETLVASRWTEKKRQRIRDSRVLATKTLAKALAELDRPPKVWINASAIGYYGDQGDHALTEADPKGSGFLADLAAEWEDGVKEAVSRGIRIVTPRFGVVLDKSGGALQRMLLPFKLGFGGVMGTGKQYMSWIALDDAVRAIAFCLTHPELAGAVNVTAPHPVTNYEFTKTLGKVLRRPTLFWMPVPVVKALFGEMGQELFLKSAKVLPARLEKNGFVWNHVYLDETLRHIIKS